MSPEFPGILPGILSCVPGILSRRMQIYKLASKYQVPILEDDYDHEFHYDSQPLPPLASQDPEGLVIYIITFTKVLFPASRIGFMAVPDAIYKAFVGYREIVTSQHITIIQDAVARWMQSGGLERHLRRMRRVYKERRDTIVQCVNEAQLNGYNMSLKPPSGGMAIWLDLHQNARWIAQKALKQGVFINPENMYRLPKSKKVGTHVRIGFTNQSPDEIRKGFQRFLDIL